MTPPPRAAIYARISSDRAGLALGVTRQVADCRALAASRGWAVVDVFTDNDVSASGSRHRPGYTALLDALRTRHVDVVVAWHPDRLHRRPVDLEAFIDAVENASATVATVQAGELDLATASGRMVARMLGAAARHEVELKSERQRRKHEELAQAGRSAGGGDRPFGFEPDRLTVRPAEATVIRDCARRLLAGDSLKAIATDLNARGIKTSAGGLWALSTLRRVLRSGRISGQREHRGQLVTTAVWPAIITPAETARIRALLDDPARRATRPPRRYLLTGLASCASCGHTMVARPRQDGERRYICPRVPGLPGCGHVSILATFAEALVLDAVAYRLDTPEMHRALRTREHQHDDAALLTQITGDRQQLDELARLWSKKQLTVREWLTARAELVGRLAKTEAALAAISPDPALTAVADGRLDVRLSGLPIERRARLLRLLLDDVAIAPGIRGLNRLDPNRLTLRWRV